MIKFDDWLIDIGFDEWKLIVDDVWWRLNVDESCWPVISIFFIIKIKIMTS